MKQTGMTPTGEKIDVEVPEVGRPGCANCAFSILSVDGATNKVAAVECRRHAPRPGQLAAWPQVNPDDWCGMYLSRAEFAENNRARARAMGALRLLEDTMLSPGGEEGPENLNG